MATLATLTSSFMKRLSCYLFRLELFEDDDGYRDVRFSAGQVPAHRRRTRATQKILVDCAEEVYDCSDVAYDNEGEYAGC